MNPGRFFMPGMGFGAIPSMGMNMAPAFRMGSSISFITTFSMFKTFTVDIFYLYLILFPPFYVLNDNIYLLHKN